MAIIGTLPNSIQNGQTEDAVPVMGNFNWIVTQVNANAAGVNVNNHFTVVQTGISGVGQKDFATMDQILAPYLSIAAIKAITPAPVAPIVVVVLGFATPGDGGGGFYFWNNTDTTPDNGGTIIQLSLGGNGRFNKLFT